MQLISYDNNFPDSAKSQSLEAQVGYYAQESAAMRWEKWACLVYVWYNSVVS